MKKLFTTITAVAVLIPGLALADTYVYRDDGTTAVTSAIYQDQVRVTDDRATLSRDQDILQRDRSFGNWWAISGDVWRVRQDEGQLNNDLTTFDADRDTLPRTYSYTYYR